MDLSKLSASDGTGEAVRGLVTAPRTAGSTVLTSNSMVNWPSDFVATTGPLLSNGQIDPDNALVFRGHISGSDVVIDELAPGYVDDRGSVIGDVIVIKPTTWWADTIVDTLTEMQESDTEIDTRISGGWSDLAATVSTVAHNGNRSYDVTFGSSVASILSPGYRGYAVRNVAGQTQSTSLNGTNQFWSKSSPSGVTFTDDFTAMGWIKLNAYGGTQGIIGRYSGNGWFLRVISTGQVVIYGEGGGTSDYATSYQSIPLNRWVHVAATLDMSGSASNIYINGILVPSAYTNGATTSLTQAGNLVVGNATTSDYFNGKIAQAAVFSSVLSASTIRSYMSQGLAGTETSLVSAYSFNGSANDLNTTNVNNLTAQNSATATNADAPFGGQADGTIANKDYFIVQKVNGTVATVQVAEGCALPTSGGISSVKFSNVDTPYGFPKQPRKWNILAKYKAQTSTVINNTTGQMTGFQIVAPVGEWVPIVSGFILVTSVATSYVSAAVGLSEGTTTLLGGPLEDTVVSTPSIAVVTGENDGSIYRSTDYSTDTQRTLYGLARTSGNFTVYHGAATVPTIIELKNAYL